jgi:flagellar basal-body rod protein FlgF
MSIDGIASAASALRYLERRQEVVSNNLANASTDGFKAERVFARLFNDALPVPDTATDLRGGALKETGGPLDLSIQGDGFFVVNTPNGERWSRGGSLRLDADGYLADAAGHRLLGERGPIHIGSGTVQIDATGLVNVNGAAVDRLRIETVSAVAKLQHEAGTLFVPDASRAAMPVTARNVKQGFLEESNVNTIGSMVDMITIQRAYQSAQKAMTTLDAVRATISNDLGKI